MQAHKSPQVRLRLQPSKPHGSPPSRTVRTQQSTCSQGAPGRGPRPTPRVPSTSRESCQARTAGSKHRPPRSAPPRSARGNAASSLGLPGTTAWAHRERVPPPPPQPPPRRRHLLPASASPPPGARWGRRPGSAPQCVSFPPGTAAATSHPGAQWRRRCWGPGAWRELLRGRRAWEEGRRAGPWLRRLKRDSPNGWGGARAKAARRSPRTGAGGWEGSGG